MSDEKAKWHDLGNVVVWDTDNKGSRRKSKDGKPFHAGMGTITVNGTTIQVYVKVNPSARSGGLNVSLSQPPPKQ